MRLINPIEVATDVRDGRTEVSVSAEGNPHRRVTLVFDDPERCRRLGRVMHEAALQMERAEALSQADTTEGGE